MVYWIVIVLAWIVWHIIFRIRVVGRENIPHKGPFVLVPNHISAIDPVFVVITRFFGRRMQIMAKAELFENPFLGLFLNRVGCVAVSRGKGDTEMLEKVVERCKKGRGLLVFAEGTRSKEDAWPGKIKSGAFVVAQAAQAPIIPCRIIYCTPDRKMHLFCKVKICYGQPIAPAPVEEGQRPSTAKLRQNKEAVAAAWRQLYQDNKLDWMPDQPLPEKRPLRTRAREENEE